MATTRLTIGALARQAGVSPQTLRHYHALGLLHPSGTSRAGYRYYDERDRARLELIRALRALDLPLDTIGGLLRGATSARAVAELHLRALDLQIRTLGRRRAVLRVLVRGDGPMTAERLARLQVLSDVEQRERSGFLARELGKRLAGAAHRGMQEMLQRAVAIDLPDDATEAQVEAWLELAEMVADESFLERYRQAPTDARPPGATESGAAWQQRLAGLYGPAADAARRGVDPTGAAGRRVARRWMNGMLRAQGRRPSRDARADAVALRAAIERGRDARAERFWELVAILRPESARSPIALAWPWLMRAVAAMAQPRASRAGGRRNSS